MMFVKKQAGEKRVELRAALQKGGLLRFPGVLNPLSAMLIERHGFDGVYVSGGAFAASLGVPDIGLTTLSEVAEYARTVARATNLPVLVDADTGFGEPMNAARTVQMLEDAGVAGCHMEDQVNPKRCGHLDNKQLVSVEVMVQRLRAAAQARNDKNFLLTARTDARAVEGLEASVERARAYLDAGAEMIFAEALENEEEFRWFKEKMGKGWLLANMTEFGKSELLDREALERAGADVVIYPVTALRLAMGALERGYEALARDGHQRGLLEVMQTRSELYDLLEYERYGALDEDVYNFSLQGNQ